MPLRTCGRTASSRASQPGELRLVRVSQEASHGRQWGVDRRVGYGVVLMSVPSRLISKESRRSVWPGVFRVVRDVEDRIHAENVREDEEVQVQRVVPDHEPVVCQPAEGLCLLRDPYPLRVLDRHQGGEEVGHRARAADPGQKRRYGDHPLAPGGHREEPAVVRDLEPQVLDRAVLDRPPPARRCPRSS